MARESFSLCKFVVTERFLHIRSWNSCGSSEHYHEFREESEGEGEKGETASFPLTTYHLFLSIEVRP